MPAPLENQTQHKHVHTRIKIHEESDMQIARRTYSKDTIHTHTQIYMTYTLTQTCQQVLPFPCSSPPPAWLLCVCADSGDHEDKPSRRCRAPILGVVAARPWSRGGVPPRWLWPEEKDRGMLGQMVVGEGHGHGNEEW